MRRSLFVSVAFHLAILLLAAAGLPASRPDVAPMPDSALSVELVDVAEKSNLPPAPSPKMEVKPEEKPKPPEQARVPEPVKREQPPPPPPPPPPVAKAEPVPPPPPPPAAKAEPVPPPVAKAEPAPPPPAEPETKAEPEKAAPPPQPEPAPVAEPAPAPAFAPKRKVEAPPRPVDEPDKVAQAEPKKAEPKPEAKPETKPVKPEPAKAPEPAKPKADTNKPKPDTEMDFAAVLKSLETKRQAAPGEPSRGESRAGSEAANASGKNSSETYDASLPVTMSEIDGVRRQIEQCWNLPAGARDAPDLRVTIVVDMNADGTPRTAAIDDQGQMQANPYYRVAAESALRAVLNPRCHPFK
ncbi:MAG: hypothetical protein JNM75_09780, partial [Rhodospirillales bacterium]|nr:hypothetical protein [Rhodospirillales bacterium]